MHERHNVFHENATPSAASAVASPELPWVGTISGRPGKLRARGSRSVPHIRFILSALASVAAVVFLVFVCSRIYTKRRVIQDLQFRRLAGADDGDEAIDACRLSGDEDDEQKKQSPPLPSLPAENEGNLPLKKRILLKAAGSSAAGEGSNPQQEEQQQQHDEAASPPVQPASRPEQRGSSPRPVPSSPSSAQGLTSEEVDAATGVLHLPPHQEAAPSVATGESRKHEVEVKRLQRQVRKLRRQLRRERRHHQWVLRRLQRQDEQAELVQRQQQQQQQQQQHLQFQYLQWQQLRHQQVLLQTVASQQQLQRPLQRPEQQSPVQQQQIQDQTQSSEQQQQVQEQQQDATMKEKDRKRRREREREEAEQPEAKRQSPEDEWVDSESEEPQPSSSQQALQQSVAAAEAAADGSPLARELTSVLTRKSEEPRDPGGIEQHPFVRLPRRMVATVPSFYLIDFRNAMICNAPRRDALPLLARAHDILALSGVYPVHLKELSRIGVELVTHMMRYQHFDLRQHSTARATERLGLRFLLMDTLVSIIEVLGQKVDTALWEQFINTVSHEYPGAAPWGKTPDKTLFYVARSQELSEAIQVLKTGKRLPAEKLVQMKRMILCSGKLPFFFRIEFDRWREDEKKFLQMQENPKDGQ